MDVCCLLLCGTTYGQKRIQKAAILIKINFRWFPNFPPSFPIFLTQNLKKWEIERRKYWEINFNIQIATLCKPLLPAIVLVRALCTLQKLLLSTVLPSLGTFFGEAFWPHFKLRRTLQIDTKAFQAENRSLVLCFACLCVRWWCTTTLLNETSLSKKTHCSKLISKKFHSSRDEINGFFKMFCFKMVTKLRT